jgi:hypothetical protein
MDAQVVLSSIEQLLTTNGWVASKCATLTRPFGQNNNEDGYEDLAKQGQLYYVGMVIHSADHFLVDQLAVIIQLARRLGTSNLFVSMLDYDSSDSTETLTDLCEAVLTLLGIPFRIRRVPGMTEDPTFAYYPLEEAHARNLALEPLHELWEKRSIKFQRVIWLKGFTCPNDILETIRISVVNSAAMVCGMDWAEHNGFFIFSDRCVVVPFCNTAQLTRFFLVGERVISMATSLDNQNPHRCRLHHRAMCLRAMLWAPNVIRNIFRSKYSAVNLVRISSTQHNRIMLVSHIGQAPNFTTLHLRTRRLFACRMINALIARRHGSAEIFGCLKRRRV